MPLSRVSSQSPKSYDLQNLQPQQIGQRVFPQVAGESAVTDFTKPVPADIRRYGASTTATAAVNTAAIQAAQASNGGVAYIPPGAFNVTAAITNIGLFGPGTYVIAGVTQYPNSIETGVACGYTGKLDCTAFGYQALSLNGTVAPPGNNNTAFGYKALRGLTGGASNPTGSTAVGYIALQNSNGATNTAIGDNTMASDLTGSDNTAVGAQALFTETNSTGNNCYGFQCGYYITTGNANCLFGNYAGGGLSQPSGTGITTGTGNCGFGGSTLTNVGASGGNTAVGTGALQVTTGGANLALGYFAGNHATSSSEFYLDNQDRGSNANEVANAMMYGNFGIDAAHNRLRLNAQLSASVGTLCTTANAPTIASIAGAIAPVAAITFVSGTAAITGITNPPWMGNGGRITLIPTGAFTWTTATNIALAGTAVVGKALDFIWDNGTSKWYPSYIA